MSSPIKIESLDHLVLTVASIPTTVAWYTTHLGMTHEVFGTGDNGEVQRNALLYSHQKINLHQHGSEFEPKAQHVQPGSGDLCFLTDTPIEAVHAYFQEKGLEILEGGEVVGRTGAAGKLRSVYVRDPDGNLVEVSNVVG